MSSFFQTDLHDLPTIFYPKIDWNFGYTFSAVRQCNSKEWKEMDIATFLIEHASVVWTIPTYEKVRVEYNALRIWSG